MEARHTQALALRSQLEDDVNDLLTQVYALRRRINTLPPISKLPEDILIMVFKVHLLASFYTSQHKAYAAMLCWLRVTHVCHVWREIAINCPTLWTYIVLPEDRKDVEYLRTVLSRSAKSPLHFRAFGRVSDPRMVLFEIALTQLPRMVSVEFEPSFYSENLVTPAREAFFVTRLLNHDAPLLSSFRVNFKHLYHQDGPDTYDPRFLLDALCLPSLTELHLWGQPYRFVRRFFQPTLTSLSIGWADDQQAPPSTELLNALSQMPLLEILRVSAYNAFEQPNLPHAVHPSLVELPRLRSLTLSTGYWGCQSFFQSLSLPNTVAFEIFIPKSDGPQITSDEDLFLPILKEHLFQSNSRRPLRVASVQFYDSYFRHGADIIAWEDVGQRESIPRKGKAAIRITMDDIGSYSNFRSLRRLYNTLPLFNLVSLVITDARRQCPSAYWRRLFNLVPVLKHLEVSGSASVLVCCLQAMQESAVRPNSESSEVGQKTLVVPLLTTLAIGPKKRRPRSGRARLFFLNLLVAVLDQRSKEATPIKKLTLLWGPKADRDQLWERYGGWVDEFECLFVPDYEENDEHVSSNAPSDETDGESAVDSEPDD